MAPRNNFVFFTFNLSTVSRIYRQPFSSVSFSGIKKNAENISRSPDSRFILYPMESWLRWVCVCLWNKTKKFRDRLKNLVTHVQSQHPDDLLKLESSEFVSNSDSHESPKSLFNHKKTIQVNGWLKLVLEELLPFRVVESHVYWKSVKFPPISKPTLMKHMSLLTKLVESKVSLELPDIFDRRQIHHITCACLLRTPILLKI